MRVVREVAVGAAAPALWALLWNVPRIVECVPGCVDAREVEVHRRYVARMKQKVGPISVSIPLEVHVVEAAPERRLVLEARGRDPVVGAAISMRVVLDIEGRAQTSLLRVDAEGQVLGKLGALGHGVIQRKAEEALDEFGARLQRVAQS